jgi:hypothetical protein
LRPHLLDVGRGLPTKISLILSHFNVYFGVNKMPLEGLLEQYNRDHNTNLHFSELLSSNDVNGMPLEPGVYVWYFQNIPNVRDAQLLNFH